MWRESSLHWQQRPAETFLLVRVLELNSFHNLMLTPQTLVRALVTTGLVRENADLELSRM